MTWETPSPTSITLWMAHALADAALREAAAAAPLRVTHKMARKRGA
jgi:hypothetical protein